MTPDKQEMALWSREYVRSTMVSVENRAAEADAAVAQFRKRYPAEPAAPDQADNAGATALITLLDDIAGDSAFSGLGQSMQSRIYAAIESLRKGQPAAPEIVWYDEPPFPKDGKSYPCWVNGDAVHGDACWYDSEWRVWIVGSAYQHPLNGRRVCPITKPQEPTT